MAIAAELPSVIPGVEIKFVSYATGAATFQKAGVPVIDLQLPEKNSYLATFFKAQALIAELQPDIVIAHEEFAALAAAKLQRCPSIFISAWLPEKEAIAIESVAQADSVIVLGDPGIFSPPPGLRATPLYIGDVVRKLSHTRADRGRLRAELELQEETFVVTVIPGGWMTEEKAPLADRLLGAFSRLEFPAKMLFWLASNDYEFLVAKSQRMADVRICRFTAAVEKFMALSDVVVTRGTRGTTLEAASLGVRTISVSPGLNPIDDVLVPRIRSNIALNAKATNEDVLLAYLGEIAAERSAYEPKPLNLHERGVAAAAQAFAREIARLTRNTG